MREYNVPPSAAGSQKDVLTFLHSYRECSKYSLALGDDHLEKAIGYAQQELDIEVACVGTDMTIGNSAKVWLATLLEKREARAKQACDKEETAKQVADKAAYAEGKMAWEAAKKTMKKSKRMIRAVARMAAVPDDAEMLLEALSPESIEALAGKLRGKTNVQEVRAILKEDTRNLRNHDQIKEDDLRSLE